MTDDQLRNEFLNFGKRHRGKRLNEIPRNYLEWIISPKCDLAPKSLKDNINRYLSLPVLENKPEPTDDDCPF